MDTRPITAALFLAFASLCAAQEQAPPEAAPAAPEKPVLATKEYFVQQAAGEALVVRVRAFEAEFVSRLTTTEGEKLSQAGLPDARMLPLYQFVAEPGEARQVDIDIAATQVTNRSEFELELIRLNVRDERSAGLANAYRYLSLGLELLPGGTVPDWTVKVQSILRAETLFAEIGMEELRLMCRLYAAHLALTRLRDAQTALDWAEGLMASPRIDRFAALAFGASKLRSSAMAATVSAPGGGDPLASPLQRALADTIMRARSLEYRFEEALALQASAVDLKAQGQPAPALERLQEALSITEKIAAADLAAAVREHIVDIHEEFGDVESTGDVLRDIETHLLETGESEELAHNLLQQGRLHLARHRYAAAIGLLSRATELEQSALSRIEVQLALGSALNEAGRAEEALVHLYRGVVQPETGDFRKPGPALDLFSPLGDIAAIHRRQEDFERMAQIRGVQEAYARNGGQRAEWAYQRALDALLQGGPAVPETRDRFEAAWRRAGASGERAWQALAMLRLCALHGDDPRCADAAAAQAREDARAAGGARQAAEADLLYSQLLRGRGETGRALAASEVLVDELLASGRAPLGAWYWQWRGPLIENHLGLAMQAEGGGDASRSLLALARARAVERDADARSALNEPGLRDFLQSLPREAAVLAFFLTDSAAQAWVGRRSGIRRIALGNPAQILALCADLRRAIEAGDGDAYGSLTGQLGERLLGPLAASLPEKVLLLGLGPLLGIPVDALVVAGAPLAAGHSVVQLDAFPAAPGPGSRLRLDRPDAVFLAGDPRDWSGDFAVRLDASTEVEAVTGHFVGPGLHAVQGIALLRDEFEEGSYGGADIVHLSVPGTVDLSPARASALLLSEPARGQGRQRLDAAALRGMPLRAGLVFLSRTEFSGSGALLENDLGVVSAVLDAGAGAVIASLWPVGDEARGRFVSNFYAQLQESKDAAAALSLAKRESMRAGEGRDWASFQLFLD